MSNTEWKNGYEAGFAAGWKAAKQNVDMNYQNFPPVYYGVNPLDIRNHTDGPTQLAEGAIPRMATMADGPTPSVHATGNFSTTVAATDNIAVDNPFITPLRENVDSDIPKQKFNNIKAFLDPDKVRF